MLKIFVATPAFDGKVNVQFALSFAETCNMLSANNIHVVPCIVTSGSLLCAERNRLLKAFLSTDCTHILCIDSDLGWPAQSVGSLIRHNEDFVGGVYPARGTEKTFLFRPILKEDGSLTISEKKLIEMESICAGFMLIKRHVIEKMVADNPQLYFKPKDPNAPDGYCLFNTELQQTNGEFNEFWGEDYTFCQLARKSGFKIFVDPMIEFDHAGTRGMLASVLTNEKPS